jgi:thioredoxin-like negative regulator of GroEL
MEKRNIIGVYEEDMKRVIKELIEKGHLEEARELLGSFVNKILAYKILKNLAEFYINRRDFDEALRVADLIEDEQNRKKILKEIDKRTSKLRV